MGKLSSNYPTSVSVEAALDRANRAEIDIEEIKQKVDMFVTPQMFGAIGDGETNDTVAFQDAISYAKRTKKVLRIPKGNYVITSSLDASSLSIIGESANLVTLTFNSGNLTVGGFRVAYRDFRVINNQEEIPAIDCFYLSQGGEISGLYIKGYHGLRIRKTWYATISNISIECDSTNGVALELEARQGEGVNAVNFSGLWLSRCKHAVEFSGGNAELGNNGFLNCTMEHLSGTAIEVSTSGTCWGNKFDTIYFEDVKANANPVLVKGNNNFAEYIVLKNALVRDTTSSSVLCKGNVLTEYIHTVSGGKICTDDRTVQINNYNVLYTSGQRYIGQSYADYLNTLDRSKQSSYSRTLYPHGEDVEILRLKYKAEAMGTFNIVVHIIDEDNRHATTYLTLMIGFATQVKVIKNDEITSWTGGDLTYSIETGYDMEKEESYYSILLNYAGAYDYRIAYISDNAYIIGSNIKPYIEKKIN